FALTLSMGMVTTSARAEDGRDRIDSVLVFPDRAEITRIRSAACRDDKTQAVFERLPIGLDALTLRAGTRDGGEAIGLQSETDEQNESVEERVRATDEKLRQVRLAVEAEEGHRQSLEIARKDLLAFAGVLSATMSEEMRNARANLVRMGHDIDVL